MKKIGIIYTTFATRDDATRIIRDLIASGAAKCGNIAAAHLAIYPWKGELCEEDEIAALIKTSDIKVPMAVAQLKSLHPYDVPCILTWMVDASDEYADWIEND